MGYNTFIDKAMGDDIQNQHQWVFHRWAKALERGWKNIWGVWLESFFAWTVTNLADHIEWILNPIIDSGREIKGIVNSDSKLKDTARFLFLHTPFAAVDSAVATAKSVVWVPSKFMLRFPLRWYRDYANSNAWANYDGAKGFWKTLTTAWLPVGAWIWLSEWLAWGVTWWSISCAWWTATASIGAWWMSLWCMWGTWVAATIQGTGATTLWAVAAANPLLATAVWSAAVAPVADMVASWVHRTISNMRTSSIVSNRNNEKKDWYSNTAVYWTAANDTSYEEEKKAA